MSRIAGRVLAVTLSLSASLAIAATSAPVAYVYVSSNYSDTNNRVVGYAANANGQLTQISGSPWADNLYFMAVNGTYLFGSDNVPNDDGRNIYSYRIESNGALQYLGATDIQKFNEDDACNDGQSLLLDHNGSYLYSWVAEADCNSEAAIESFAVNQKTGLLEYLGLSNANVFSLGFPLTMATDNVFAYASANNGMYGQICGFQKGSNGALNTLPNNCNNPWPSGKPSNWTGYGGVVTADTTNHLAMNMSYYDPDGTNYAKMATFAINTSNGTLTTNSTFTNMPETDVTDVSWIMMAPSGKLFAVAGNNGIQIFNFNPNGQATANTGLITTAPITMMYWDNSNHLYAISNTDSTIHVFTVTPTSATEVSGSPYSVDHPVTLIVQPK